MKPAARASSASRSAGGTRASRSSDGSLARDPRGNESRADQRLSSPAGSLCLRQVRPRRSKYSLHRARLPIVISRLGEQRNALPARTCRTRPAHFISDKAEQAHRRSDALARRRELMDARAWHCEGADGYTPMTWPCPARPFVGRNAKATPPDVGKPQSCSQFYSGPQTAIYLGTTWAL